MTEETNILPTSDERMLGALAHFFGIIGALIIWVLQKDKSRFVRFQAAQALAFDFVVTLLMMVFSLCFFGVMFLGIFGVTFASLNHAISSENFNPFIAFPFMFPWLMFLCILPFSFAFLIARVIAAISVLNGNNFHYPFLGTRVEKFLTD